MTFKDGVCLGCLTHLEKDNLDWDDRQSTLLQSFSDTLKKNRSHYDCVVPIRGDAEDYFVVKKVLEFGLKPLIVAVNDYFINDIGWFNLHNLITVFDVDSIIHSPELSTYKELVRTSLRKLNHALWPSISLRTAFPVHIAVERKIPLIIWGGLQSLEQVGKFSHLDNVEMSGWNRLEHDLFNVDFDELIGTGAQINPTRCDYYQYPEPQFKHGRVRGIYLSNFFAWDPLTQNKSILEYGFQPQKQSATYDVFERAGDSVYYNIHDLLKFERCGYRRVRDQLSRDIRHGHISLDKAIEAERYYNTAPIDVSNFFDWLGVTETGKDWFVKHRLKNSHSLLKHRLMPHFKHDQKLTGKLADAKSPNELFLKFYKGI